MIRNLEEIEQLIRAISDNCAILQTKYREWANEFNNHNEVIHWLFDKGIKSKQIKKQKNFNLFSSHWNSITTRVLKTICPQVISCLKNNVTSIQQNRDRGEIDKIWYLMYFLHPGRHELYYFDEHFPEGYPNRLESLVRSHRLGLKSVCSYLQNDGRTLNDAFISACSTVAFKHLHLHPTTILWEKPSSPDIKNSIMNLRIGNGEMSSDERRIVMYLAQNVTGLFTNWFEYAPCAVNEGPIFILRKNKSHTKCYEKIVSFLESGECDQDILRNILEKYYEIEV